MSLVDRNKEQHRPLLDLNDKIGSVCGNTDIPVPSIVVGGDQSHGKTSLIESLSAIEMPRGEGMQTRVPVKLRMRVGDKEEVSIQRQSHIGKRDPTLLKKREISEKVKQVSEDILKDHPGKAVFNEEVNLRVVQPDSINLTITDLPGICQIAEKHENIAQELLELYERQLKPPEATILSVVSCDVDVQTSICMKLAMELDERRERIIICMTKADLYKGDLEARRRSFGAATGVPLDRIFCVRTRAPEDSCDLMAVQKREEALHKTKACKGVPPSNWGVPALAKYLSDLQKRVIAKTMPEVFDKLEASLKETSKELLRLGSIPSCDVECQQHFFDSIDTAGRDLRDQILGGSVAWPSANHADAAAVRITTKTVELKSLPTALTDTVTLKRVFDTYQLGGECTNNLTILVKTSKGKKVVYSESEWKATDAIQMPCTLIVQIFEHVNQDRTDSELSGALFDLRDSLVQSADNAVAPEYVFSDATLVELQKRNTSHRGCSTGLPGTAPSEPRVAMIHMRVLQLKEPSMVFLDAVKEKMTAAVKTLFVKPFREYPPICALVRRALSTFMDERHRLASKSILETFECEEITVTTSPVYETINKQTTAAIAQGNEEEDNIFTFWDSDKFKKLPQGELEALIQMFSYWSVASPRILDRVVQLVTYHVVRKAAEGVAAAIREVVLQEIQDKPTTWLALMAPESTYKHRVTFLRERKHQLEMFIEEYNLVVQ